MSLLTLQFGQCGNQVGHNFFSLLSKDINLNNAEDISYYFQQSIETWFRNEPSGDKYLARSILVDTEQKVINDIKKKQFSAYSGWEYDPKNIISHKDGGAGNNWAFGYGKKGPELKETILDCVRKNVESTDLLYGFLSFLSCAGGTGSGVGSYIVNELNSEYPTKTFVNSVILPYSAGEVVTQNYNTVLALAKLYDVTDMFIIFSNDQLHRMSTNLLKNANTQLQDLNDLIAIKMGSIFQPINDTPLFTFSDIVSQLAAHLDYKLVTIKSAPHYSKESQRFESDISWNVLTEHMKQTLKQSEATVDWETKSLKTGQSARHSQTQYVASIGNSLITRGDCNQESGESLETYFSNKSMYPQWIPMDSRFQHFHQNRKYLNMSKFVSLVSNNSSIYHLLNNISERAWKVYSHGAHVHQYEKFCVSKCQFLESFAKVERIIKSYKELK